ncbi:MAG: folate family ECF transporter S component [Ruminococcus sp.]|nr:folate family ECF transporter S component [Ruminococcus sp.]
MNTNNTAAKSGLRVFGSTKVLIASALLAAISIVLSKFVSLNLTDSIRIGFGALPIQMAGVFFGPVVGGVVGLVADVIGCILRGYSINPIITLGYICIGTVSGFMFHNVLGGMKKNSPVRVALSTFPAHIFGSMIIISFGLYVYYHTPLPQLLVRIPIYLITSAIETVIISVLLRNKLFVSELEKVQK